MMKERIYQMKNGVGKESLFRKVIGAGVMGITVFTSSLTVFAYSPKMIMYSNSIATDMYFSFLTSLNYLKPCAEFILQL